MTDTPIYDRLAAEYADRHQATRPFRQAATITPAAADKPRDWFTPTEPEPTSELEPAPARVEPTPPPGLRDIANILAMSQVALSVQQPNAAVRIIGTLS
ncbi:hypothetical protein ACFOY2_46210 [Nonomuraea purpurea]|uniref:Uncharacterized protein n=1 Tax=Nonomuraea purpurea TaxID=1849276 RepID=A0ABV8GL79_9ACTN